MADHPVLDLLSECSHVIGLLEENGHRALARVGEGERLEWDAYPSSSLPEGSIARGRVSDPTALAVIRHAGGLDPDADEDRDKLAEKGPEAIADKWNDRYDPIGVAVNRMNAESHDACNRLATAQEAALAVQGMGAEIFGRCDVRKGQTTCGQPWAAHLDMLKQALHALVSHRDDLELRWPTEEQKAATRRMVRELEDAKNRLRTAERSMREALPTKLPEKSRELCKSCSTPRDIATDWGAHPRNWIAGEASCRACVERTVRHRKGKAS